MDEFLKQCYEYYNNAYKQYNDYLNQNSEYIKKYDYYIGDQKYNSLLKRIDPKKNIIGHFYDLIIRPKEVDSKFESNFDCFSFFFNFITKEPLEGFKYHQRNMDFVKENYNRRPRSFNWFTPSKHLYKYSHDFIMTDSDTEEFQITANGDFCKAYLSIKPENYINVIIKLQDFINYLYEKYKGEKLSFFKFRFFPANDAITIRFTTKEQYDEFLFFLDSNKEIVDSFDEPNAFMPQDDHGLCVIPDEGNSYNDFISKIIYEYIDYCKNNNLDVSLDKFVQFINNYNCDNDIIINNSERIEEKFKSIFVGKIVGSSNEELLSMVFENKSKIK
ncbi:MAG: hypothetical protein Q4E75_02045 [bacterium]|nr:hypothetical protein [bacterium]